MLFIEFRFIQSYVFQRYKTVYVDERTDNIYIGAHAGGMIVLNRRTGQQRFFNTQNSDLPSNNVYSILPDGYGGLWIASLNALIHYDIANNHFQTVDRDSKGHRLQEFNGVLFRDSKRRIWAGGEMGLSIYNQTNTSLTINTDYDIAPILQRSFINCFYESASGHIWVGTRNGLFALKESTKDFLQYTTADGLPSNVIYGILEDSYGRLWISTNQGLSCLNPENRKLRNFTIVDGLQSNQFNAGSFCRISNGNMLLEELTGLLHFVPKRL